MLDRAYFKYRRFALIDELPVNNQDRLTYVFEVTLFDGTGERPHEERLRETIHNPRLAACTAEAVATHGDAFANGWDEGVAPRLADIDTSG